MTQSAEKDAPIQVVYAMVRLAETFGHTLPWANLTEACEGLASHDALRWAVEDLTQEGAIEATPKGLRLALTEPPIQLGRTARSTRVTPPGSCSQGHNRSAGRWCAICGQHGSHHTERHDEFTCCTPPGNGDNE